MAILDTTPTAAGTRSSVVVERCQICGHAPLEKILFLGFLPPVNQLRPIGELPREQPAYPALWLACPQCTLVQLGLIVDKEILFPPEYPYTSGTTKILRDNFAELYTESQTIVAMTAEDLAIDVGSNDGTLLSNFHRNGHRVLGIEPSQVGNLANDRGIPTTIAFFARGVAEQTRRQHGPAKIVVATNVFAHIEHLHEIVESILLLMGEGGIFISESHYLLSLVETLQYDTIYHEHLRYYSLRSLRHLFKMHGLEVIHARQIPTHGGSIRVYAARAGQHPVRPSVAEILAKETAAGLDAEHLRAFKSRVVQSKLDLYALLKGIKQQGHRIYGIGAPSRASTLITYVGLDDGILDCVLEIQGSLKIGKYMPGTLIPVVEESRLYADQPEYALLLSWHIADELIPKLRQKGYRGKFIRPLPVPAIV
jgi:C-methyltransferase C-terminal domain/Methyltransferase domain/Putative zinc binding domain